MPTTPLAPLSDDQLLKTLDRMVCTERARLVDILHHLNEVDRRKLHLAMGFRSLFHYCVNRLRYSESAAGRRIATARALCRFPGIGPMLESGDVNLSTVSCVARLLTADNHVELLEQIRGKSRREVERLTADAQPKPVRPDRIRVICAEPTVKPAPTLDITPAGGSDSSCDDTRAGEEPVSALSDAAERTALNAQATSRREPGREVGRAQATAGRSRPDTTDSRGTRNIVHEIRFVAGDAFIKKLERVQVLLSHRAPRASFEQVFDAAMEVFLDANCPIRRDRRRRKRRARQAKTATSPVATLSGPGRAAGSRSENPPLPPAGAGQRGIPATRRGQATRGVATTRDVATAGNVPMARHIPTAVRDAVYVRDRGRCAFAGPDGRRCNSRHLLEVDHIVPFARGGAGVASNLRLLCHAHNRLAAERDFGLAVMNRYRQAQQE